MKGESKLLYKIDDVAKECGLTKRSIRYYEEIGLISPPERSEGGFRLYTDKHIERLKQIMNVRDVLGFSLQEVQEYISISEIFGERLQQYRETLDEDQKREKLIEIEGTLSQQLQMIDQKLKKMNEIRNDMNEKYQRVLKALEK